MQNLPTVGPDLTRRSTHTYIGKSERSSFKLLIISGKRGAEPWEEDNTPNICCFFFRKIILQVDVRDQISIYRIPVLLGLYIPARH